MSRHRLSALRSRLSRVKATLEDAARIVRVVTASRHSRVVGYTKNHPIYTDVFEEYPPDGFVFYRRVRSRLLSIADRWVWRRLDLLHLDAASPRPADTIVPIVVECEGQPHDAFFHDRLIQHVFVESRWAAGNLLEQGRVSLLRPSVALPRQKRRTAARANDAVLLAVGHGGMVKGLDIVVGIYEALKHDHPIRLIIAGSLAHNFQYYPEISQDAYDRADFGSLQVRLASDDRVTIRSWPRRVLRSRIYPAADIYLHLSRLETFGYSILEAMSHEMPVVATRLHAIPEMVLHGETGFLVDPQGADVCSEEWSTRVYTGALEAARLLLEDSVLRERMGVAGRRRVAKVFDIEFKRRELTRVYRQVLGRRSFTGELTVS